MSENNPSLQQEELDDEVKDLFKKAEVLRELLKNKSMDNIEEVAEKIAKRGQTVEMSSYNLLVFLLCFLFVTSLLAFFGYKLYKSYSERERKREEKRRLKQLKKKK